MDKTYTIIPDFMLDFDLNMTETVALAVIYGFCQDGKSDFHGSYTYLARKCKVTRSWAVKIMNHLVRKGLVSKVVTEKNGVKSCSFRYKGGSVDNTPVVKKLHQGSVESTPGGSVESTPNNISNENIRIIKREGSDFVPPTLDQVKQMVHDYRLTHTDPTLFWIHFSEREWKYNDGKPMKSLKRALYSWEKREQQFKSR